MNVMLSVALGGAIGAVGRYWISSKVGHLLGLSFPWGTLAVNVLGCAALGALVQLMALAWSPPEELRALLTVGMLGALTTFSAFSLEIVLMVERGQWPVAMLYIVLSVVLCVGAMFLSMAALRAVLA